MAAILTPAQALRHLRQLSTDVRAALVLAADGRVLAADGAPADPPAADGAALLTLLDAAGGALAAGSGRLLAVGGTDAGALVVAAGPHALTALLLHDLDSLLNDLGAGPSSRVQTREPADSPAATAIFARLGLLDPGNS